MMNADYNTYILNLINIISLGDLLLEELKKYKYWAFCVQASIHDHMINQWWYL